MLNIFAIFGVVIVVAMALTLVSWGMGYFTNSCDCELPAFIWCILISSAIISFFVITFVLEIKP